MNEHSYILSCCSTADLTEEHFKERDIHYVCFHFELDGKTYPDDLGKSVPFDTFYKAMENGADTKTSQVNVEEYIAYFTPFLEAGQDIVHLTLSSGISGTYNSACLAVQELAETFPERKIYVIDSLAASSGYGLFMDKLADLRDKGMDAESLAHWAETNKLRLNHWFFPTDLTYLIRGGRVSKTSGAIAGLLNICPLMNVDFEGHLIPRQKIRTKKKVIQATAEKMAELADGQTGYDGKCYICQSACYEDARMLADIVESTFPHLNGKVEINSIGTVIGSHTGPGTIGLFFWGKKREN